MDPRVMAYFAAGIGAGLTIIGGSDNARREGVVSFSLAGTPSEAICSHSG